MICASRCPQLYNEPNGPSWTPHPNSTAYSVLAHAVAAAMQRACPGETLVGPAAFEVDPGYLTALFQLGVLPLFAAVSVHPYRLDAPETALASFANVHALVAEYAPPGAAIPVLSGEWGYTTCAPICIGQRVSLDLQARYLGRTWLLATLSGAPIAIWYDWRDDGPDAAAEQQNFGTVEFAFVGGAQPFVPKPSYIAAATLAEHLAPDRFERQIEGVADDGSTVFALAFRAASGRGCGEVYAAWAVGGTPTCTQPALERRDCGYLGISPPVCAQQGCCYRDGACFRPARPTTATLGTACGDTCFRQIDYRNTTVAVVCSSRTGTVELALEDAATVLVPVL